MNDINRRMATEIMGECWHECEEVMAHFEFDKYPSKVNWCTKCNKAVNYSPNPDYLTDWNALRLVIEKMREKGFAIEMGHHPVGGWFCEVSKYGAKGNALVHLITSGKDTLPEAVCLAALATTEKMT